MIWEEESVEDLKRPELLAFLLSSTTCLLQCWVCNGGAQAQGIVRNYS